MTLLSNLDRFFGRLEWEQLRFLQLIDSGLSLRDVDTLFTTRTHNAPDYRDP